jgi:hypothetical protein
MNHDALGQESIDFKSDSINLCLHATLDDETGNYDEARDLTDYMLQMNKNTFTFLGPCTKTYQITVQAILRCIPKILFRHHQKTWLIIFNI